MYFCLTPVFLKHGRVFKIQGHPTNNVTASSNFEMFYFLISYFIKVYVCIYCLYLCVNLLLATALKKMHINLITMISIVPKT